MTVLVLAEDFDPTVDRVVMTLRSRGIPVCRLDLGWFPQQLAIDAELIADRWAGELRTAARGATFGDVRSIWYRSPTAFGPPSELSPARRAHACREARFGVGGVLASLPVAWMNHPHREADAAFKPTQLTLAAECGLAVPSTLITNDPGAVRRFHAATSAGLVIKPIGANVLYEDGQRKVAHTHQLTAADLADLSGVELTAHLFQEWVPKEFEVRLVAVGSTLFAVGIHTTDQLARIDWRSNYDALEYRVVDIPPYVADRVLAFMAASGLTFSALDFVVRPDGGWVFLESNPSGQYGWLRAVLGTAISDAVADWLAKEQR